MTNDNELIDNLLKDYKKPEDRFCRVRTSSSTSSVTLEINAGETSTCGLSSLGKAESPDSPAGLSTCFSISQPWANSSRSSIPI